MKQEKRLQQKLEFQVWLLRETGCRNRRSYIADRVDEGCTAAEAAEGWLEVCEEFVKAGGDPEDIP
ncbi:hypothetical protein [Paenibacillus oleatilyticus]|uniref:hypothetical protein n=1 Tax=Paenibacillus oleatilyticus TaxID=2594886 RepID=UPI001C1F28BA|nr:hypothetical protein [Paenibacillus oleatilyticus]MBU7319032.1 hypothetical protein [Paenibacillus oleatilyticus]